MPDANTAVLAKRKDLHDGRSLWADSFGTNLRTRTTFHKPTAEIAIVGGGISGSLCALELAAAGHEVVVIDRRRPGSGSTLASTAMIQFELDTPFSELCEKIGRPKASRAYRRSFQAVGDLSKLIAVHKIDARWRDRQALYLAGNEMGARGLRTETDARQSIQLPSEFLTKGELFERFGIDRTGAIISSGAAELDPARTAASCLRAAQRYGGTIVSPCDVIEVTSRRGAIELDTTAGLLRVKKAVLATGYEVVAGLPRAAFDVISSWAIATQPLAVDDLWPGRCLIWEASDPYLYARTTTDNRILVGGEDSKLTDPRRREDAILRKSDALLRKIATLLGRSDLRIEYAWAGAFADSPTGLPIIKELPGFPGTMAILGCGGNGITFSTIAAQVVTRWASGHKDPDLDLFQGTPA
jgi:glycine/D-amino acid oxidase-like deaminating enzyme